MKNLSFAPENYIMAIEIERKFLVTGEFRNEPNRSARITQGYLSSVSERTVRVRIMDRKGFLTIKGAVNATGASRYEWEKEIPLGDAMDLMKLCEPGVIDKTRYKIQKGDHIIEVDEFYGDNEGLVIAEVELDNEEEEFERPSWLGKEVTGDNRYYNSMLMKFPYKNWGSD